MRCVIKRLHFVLNFYPLDFFAVSNSAHQDEMLNSVCQDTGLQVDWYISFPTQVLVVTLLLTLYSKGYFQIMTSFSIF